jgi:hypothetical protein
MSVIRRFLASGLMATLLLNVAPAVSPAAAASACTMFPYYHYGAVFTSRQSGAYHCQTPPAPTTTWDGIVGVIGTPAGSISENINDSHVAAWIGVAFYSGTQQTGWVQIGWSEGTNGIRGTGAGCSQKTQSKPTIYVEAEATSGGPSFNCNIGASSLYYFLDYSTPMPASYAVSFLVQYQGGGCWLLTAPAAGVSDSLCHFGSGDTQGEAAAKLEIENTGVTSVTVPTTVFGAASTSAGALELHNPSVGWHIWDTTITSATYDERNNANPCVKQSDYYNYYKFLTLARTAAGC